MVNSHFLMNFLYIVSPCSGLLTRTLFSSQTGKYPSACYAISQLIKSLVANSFFVLHLIFSLKKNKKLPILLMSFISSSSIKIQGSSGTENKRHIQGNNWKQLEEKLAKVAAEMR